MVKGDRTMTNVFAKFWDYLADAEEEEPEPNTPEYFIFAADRDYEEKNYSAALDKYCRAAQMGATLAIDCLAEMYRENLIKTTEDTEKLKNCLQNLADKGSRVAVNLLGEINDTTGIAAKIFPV